MAKCFHSGICMIPILSKVPWVDVLFASQFCHVDLSQHIIDWPLEHETALPLSSLSVGTGTATARPTRARVVSLVKYMMVTGD